jgi:hypothetical protein
LQRAQSGCPDKTWISQGKFDDLRGAPARSTSLTLIVMDFARTRPLVQSESASYQVLVHQIAVLLHASFRPRLTATPLRFANPSPLSGWVKDFHLQIIKHAWHTGRWGFAPRDRLRRFWSMVLPPEVVIRWSLLVLLRQNNSSVPTPSIRPDSSTARAARQNFCESGGKTNAQGGDRVLNMTLGAEREIRGVGNFWEGQIF